MASNLLSMNPYFQPGAPGEGAFGEALASYFDELRKSGTGAGLPALAGAKAAQGPGMAYQQAMAAPSALGDAFGNNSFAQLMAGQTGANQVANATKSQVQQHGERGVGDVANNYTSALAGEAEGEIALNQAQSNQASNVLGQLPGLGSLFTNIAKNFIPGGGAMPGMSAGGAGSFFGGSSPFSFMADPGFLSGMGPFSMMAMGA